MNTETTHSETGEGKHSLADFTINRLHDALEIANKSADDQMFQKREAENEVARLRELLNKVEQSANHWEAEALRCKNSDYWHDLAVKAEAALVPAPEESVSYPTCSYCGERVFHNVPRLGDAGGFIHEGNKECPARKGCEHKHCEQIGNGTYCKACGEAVQSEVKPEWREFTHTKELVQRGDEASTFEIERWEDVSGYWQGRPANIFNRRFRTRRPLPKQEMPLEDELKDIDQYADKQNDFYTCRVFQSIEYSLRYLRGEVQKLKQGK